MSAVADLFPEVAPAVSPDEAFDERYTTRETIAWCAARAGVAAFDLDAAACEESHHAHLWYGKAENGLTLAWFGDVWVNPPYSDIAPWAAKAWAECAVAVGPEGPSLLHSVSMLIPATRTEQGWWQRDVEPFRDGGGPRHGFALRSHFLPGRTAFARPGSGGVGQSGSPFGCVLLVWRRITDTASAPAGRLQAAATPSSVLVLRPAAPEHLPEPTPESLKPPEDLPF